MVFCLSRCHQLDIFFSNLPHNVRSLSCKSTWLLHRSYRDLYLALYLHGPQLQQHMLPLQNKIEQQENFVSHELKISCIRICTIFLWDSNSRIILPISYYQWLHMSTMKNHLTCHVGSVGTGMWYRMSGTSISNVGRKHIQIKTHTILLKLCEASTKVHFHTKIFRKLYKLNQLAYLKSVFSTLLRVEIEHLKRKRFFTNKSDISGIFKNSILCNIYIAFKISSHFCCKMRHKRERKSKVQQVTHPPQHRNLGVFLFFLPEMAQRKL